MPCPWLFLIPVSDKSKQATVPGGRKRWLAWAGRTGERNVWHPEAMTAAAGYIRKTLEDTGYVVNVQSFPSRGLTVNNLEAVLPGHIAADEIIVAGAHYDSVAGTPGANDNA